ncbi:hypothetical protein Ddye_004243 [Dipteronia dyeriana]|uniref:Uncharacterized protein n=1 Tax=Dipteronia dyeriana TaxID=168575 RepID=A0AAD9XTT2_9ROSI|nr:hypothetical protein Ddye_004243 [Dipteronia dyeriana]
MKRVIVINQLHHQRKWAQMTLMDYVNSSIIDKGLVQRVISLLLEAEATIEEDNASGSSHSAIRGAYLFMGRHLQKRNCIRTGFFMENTIVLAEGEMLIDGIFQVINCGFPPLEDRDKSFKLLASHDLFGGGALTKEETLRLADLEKRAVNDMFIILSDIWLDNQEVHQPLFLNALYQKKSIKSINNWLRDSCWSWSRRRSMASSSASWKRSTKERISSGASILRS